MRLEALWTRRVRKYLLYATGELVLVIAGILIALQIDNWNDGRIAREEIREYALNLSDAIARDMAMLDPVDIQIRTSIRGAKLMAEYLRDRPLDQISNAEMLFLSSHMTYRSYGWNRAAMEQLKAAGGLRLMRNRELAERISDYEALAQHLDQDYREDEQSARARKALVASLVDLNYDEEELDDLLDWDDSFSEANFESRQVNFRNSPVYARISAENRPLLSDEQVAFRRLGNLSHEYADNTEARPSIELPRLRQFAAEIQAMIEKEYR